MISNEKETINENDWIKTFWCAANEMKILNFPPVNVYCISKLYLAFFFVEHFISHKQKHFIVIWKIKFRENLINKRFRK